MKDGARQVLRAATAAAHERVDRAFSDYALDRRQDYERFLLAQAAAFLPLEAAIDASPHRSALPDWPARRRAELLRDDLADLGVDLQSPRPATPLATPAAVFGAAYVLEGSRLGGQVIARDLPDGLPRRFLTATRPGYWRAFTNALDLAVISPHDQAMAVAAALEAFAMFESSATGLVEAARS